MSDADDQHDASIDTHPDLIDPEWNARVDREALRAVGRGGRRTRRRSRGHGSRRLRLPLGNRSLTALLGLILAVLVFALVNQIRDDSSRGPSPVPTGAIAVSSTPPKTTPSVQQHSRLDLNQPFANTPAAGWRDGATGIQPPAASRVGRWSAAEVGAALHAVRQTLIDAHLDPKLLVGHDPGTYLASLAPNVRASQQTRLNNPTDHDADGAVSLLATGYPLLPAPIKVAGSMSAATDGSGNLLIHTNYVFAFAFAPGQARDVSQAWQLVVVQHVAEDFTVLSGSSFRSADRGIWPTQVRSYADQMGCASYGKGYLAPAFSDPTISSRPPNTEDPNALYAPSHPMTVANSCPAPPQHA